MQDEGFDVLGHQVTVDAVGHDPGVGEDDRLLIRLVGQQPLNDLLFMLVVVGGDDLLTGTVVELADGVEHQVLRVFEHFADHVAQTGTAGGGGEQQGLLAVRALAAQALDVFGEAHVEHAVGFVENDDLHMLKLEVAGVQLLEHTARGTDEDIRHLAQHGGLFLEVFTTGDHAGLDEGELGETLDFLEGLLGQLTGWQQYQGTDLDTLLLEVDQTVEHRQYEGCGLAATGFRRHPQVTPLQSQGNGGRLHRSRLFEVQCSNGFEQAFVQGELGKHGCTSGMCRNSAV
ncbi:hypothetical protein D9M71_355220 [compost metagenome]